MVNILLMNDKEMDVQFFVTEQITTVLDVDRIDFVLFQSFVVDTPFRPQEPLNPVFGNSAVIAYFPAFAANHAQIDPH